HRLDGDSKPETLAKKQLHIGHADNLAPQVKERPAAVAGIDLGSGLQVKLPLQLTGFGAENALGDGPFQPKGAANGEDLLADGEHIRVAQSHFGKLRRVLVLDPEQSQIVKLIHRNDADLLLNLAIE